MQCPKDKDPKKGPRVQLKLCEIPASSQSSGNLWSRPGSPHLTIGLREFRETRELRFQGVLELRVSGVSGFRFRGFGVSGFRGFGV